MESPQAKMKPIYIYVLTTQVSRVFEHREKKHISGSGDNAMFETVSKGWYMAMEDSYEALYLGEEKPNWNPGDKVKITLERL